MGHRAILEFPQGVRRDRHCEPPGRANARPMTGSAKQSIERHTRMDGLLRRSAPRNDGAPDSECESAISRRDAPEVCRVRAAPAVSRANAHSKNAHEHTGSAENIRPSLRNGFTAYFVLSPVSRALLPPSLRRSTPPSLAPASGARTTRLRRPRQPRSSS